MLLDVIKSQRKAVSRAAKKIDGLALEINDAIPDLASDLANAAMHLDAAEEKLLTAETRIEDAKKHFADKLERPAA